jgi:DNA topoisomerase-1
MEQAKLGTKATRAGVIQTLYDRKYIVGEQIAVTDLGFQVVDVLMKHCPTILSSTLTAELEEKMNSVEEQKQNRQQLISETVGILKTVTAKLRENEDAIGAQLAEALAKSSLAEQTVGPCPDCKTGKLVILRSKKTGKRFVGCTNYFAGTCKTAFPLPQLGIVKPLQTACKSCGLPIIQLGQKGRRLRTLCLNPNCPSKKKWQKHKF